MPEHEGKRQQKRMAASVFRDQRNKITVSIYVRTTQLENLAGRPGRGDRCGDGSRDVGDVNRPAPA